MVLRVWKAVIKDHKLEEDIKILTWCAYDSDFMPNMLDDWFKSWMKKGMASLCIITQKHELMCFQTLREFSFKNLDFYRFLQLRSYYNQNIKETNIREASKPFTKLFINAYESDTKRGVISLLYKSLQIVSLSLPIWRSAMIVVIVSVGGIVAVKLQTTITSFGNANT